MIFTSDYLYFSILLNLVFLEWFKDLCICWKSSFVFLFLVVFLRSWLFVVKLLWCLFIILFFGLFLFFSNNWLNRFRGITLVGRLFITIKPRIIFIRTKLIPINLVVLWLHFKYQISNADKILTNIIYHLFVHDVLIKLLIMQSIEDFRTRIKKLTRSKREMN